MFIVAVVPTFRRPVVAKRCVEALQAQTRPPDRIIVVDNSPVSELTGAFTSPDVEVIHPGWNTGAAGGFGLGTEFALERGATHVMLVDDDCLLEHTALEQLSAGIASLCNAAVAPIVTSDGDTLVWNLFAPDGRKYHKRSELPRHPIATRSVANHGLLVSADAIRALGGPRKDLFFGAEDVEFCRRLASGGIRVLYLPDAHALHHPVNYVRFWMFGQRKVPAGTPGHRYYVLRNNLLLWRMYRQDSVIVGVALPLAREIAGMLLSRQRLRRCRLLLSGLRDGLLGDTRRQLRNKVPLHD